MGPRPDAAATRPPAWLLLVYQLPARPSNARVKTWRRLQKLGARAVRNSAYLLPNSPQAREDFEWLKAEITALKGQADVFAADTIDALSGDEIVASFRRERQQDFAAVLREAGLLLGRIGRGGTPASPMRRSMARRFRALREQWNEAAAVDFFGAPGRGEAAAALDHLDRLLAGPARVAAPHPAAPGGILMADKFKDRVWLTRPRPGIDRMATAWLIRRFLDPRARFRFAEKPEKGGATVPFDMFGVEFSHEGDLCTFENLARRFGISSPAVVRVGQIVHDLDLKDGRYGAEEAPAIGRLVEGLGQVYADDHELLEHGIPVFEALYRSFGDHPKSVAKPAAGERRGRRRKSA